VKRISANAYQALREALPVVFWFKRPFESFLKAALRDCPELLAPLDFGATKREVADALVDRLVAGGDDCQDLTIQIMEDVAGMTAFPDIESLHPPDREVRLKAADEAVARIRALVGPYTAASKALERAARETEQRIADSARVRRFAEELAEMKLRFTRMSSAPDPRQRGLDFEKLLIDLFRLHDMEPRLSYMTGDDQIDGSIRFDTDDYIMEAKWRAGPAARSDGDVFASKVARRGKNALGLFVSVNGFAKTFIDQYSQTTPFITLDGADLIAVLEGHIRLGALILEKKRHANDTGSCYWPVALAAGTAAT
jgi:hypothetical protein